MGEGGKLFWKLGQQVRWDWEDPGVRIPISSQQVLMERALTLKSGSLVCDFGNPYVESKVFFRLKML